MQTDKRTQILKKYTLLYKKHRGKTGYKELKGVGVTEKDVRYHFNNIKTLNREARKEKSEQFNDLVLEDVLKNKKRELAEKNLKKYNKFVITTVVAGCLVNEKFLSSIRNYCKLNKAKLIILIAADPAANVEWTIDKRIVEEFIVYKDLRLNSNLFISSIKLSAKHIDPTTGLGRIGQRNGSFIYASPKQRLKIVPVDNQKYPHALMTTGALTNPNYSTNKYLSERTAYIADYDHVMGAIVVEIKDETFFHYRQIQANNKGSFIDLGVQYYPHKVNKISPAAFILGDWHCGSVSPKIVHAYKEISKILKPEKVIVHDIFDARAINHHEKDDIIKRAMKAEKGHLKLEDELLELDKDIEILSKLGKELIIVKSNHDQFLDKYLRAGLYVQDPHNHKISLKIATEVLEGKDALKSAIEIVTNNKKYKNPITWLKRDDDYKISGVQLGVHGDKGANGSRGNLKTTESSYGNCIIGHSHSPAILRQAWCVGTSTYLKLDYNEGASGWMNTCCLLYPNGSKQLINIIGDKWKG